MPLVGIVDAAGTVHDPADLSSWKDYPVDLVRALVSERAMRPYPSASEVGGCLRRWELSRTTDYTVDPRARLAAMFGTGVHLVLERNAPAGALVELKLSRPVDLGDDLPNELRHLTVTGTMDYWEPDAGVIRDWKTKRYLRADHDIDAAHIFQVNIYHWLLAGRPDYKPVKQVQIVYMDQNKVQGFTGEPWPLERTERRLVAKLRTWALAKAAGGLPATLDCFTPSGRWQGLCGWCDVRDACRQAYVCGG